MSQFPLLNRDMHLGAKRKTITVDLPELEISVILREMSRGQFDNSGSDLYSQLVESIIDADGKPVYESKEALAAAFAEIPFTKAAVMKTLTEAFLELNGATQEALEEVEKKSEPSQATDSVSS